MPNTKAAKKALRVSERKRVINNVKKNKVIQSRRVLNKLFTDGKTKFTDFKEALAKYFSSLDKAAKTNYIPKQRADRLKSRMTVKIKKLTGEDKYETAGAKKEKTITKKSSASAPKKAAAKKTENKSETTKKSTAKTAAKKAPAKKATAKKESK
jgi:small subunit ribosomal protein S20